MQRAAHGVGIALHIASHLAQHLQAAAGGLHGHGQLLRALGLLLIFQRQGTHPGLQTLRLVARAAQRVLRGLLLADRIVVLLLQGDGLQFQFGLVALKLAQILLHLGAHGLLLGLGVARVAQAIDSRQDIGLVLVERLLGFVRPRSGFVRLSHQRVQRIARLFQRAASGLVVTLPLLGKGGQLVQAGGAGLLLLLHALHVLLQRFAALLHAVAGAFQLMQLLGAQAAFGARLADFIIQLLHGLIQHGTLLAVFMQPRLMLQ